MWENGWVHKYSSLKLEKGPPSNWQSKRVTYLMTSRQKEKNVQVYRKDWYARCFNPLKTPLPCLFCCKKSVMKKSHFLNLLISIINNLRITYKTFNFLGSFDIKWDISICLFPHVFHLSFFTVWQSAAIQRPFSNLCLPAGVLPGHRYPVLPY